MTPQKNYFVLEISMNNYIDITYNKKIKPYTNYPFELCSYLFHRFNMKKEHNLLDLGCGRGDFAKNFKNLGLNVFGLDREKNNSEMLRDIKVEKINIEKDEFPFNSDKFDFVFSKSVIEHLWDPDNFNKEIFRVLKPGGILILMTPDWMSQMNIFYNDFTHVHPYTKDSLEDMLKIYNFKNVKSELFYQLPILWKYPWLKIFSKSLQIFGPPKKIYKNKFIRWSQELMLLAYGEK